MTTPSGMSYEERERRAQAIYDSSIRHLIGPGDTHKYVKIDVLSGDYEIGENSIETGHQLRTRRPDSVISTFQNHCPRVIKIRSPRITRVSKTQQ
ncbi:MAG: hypothetical protein OXF79_18995 [Chloroflexi bacterium]|nr:hypothetical protein [Chloroflexota bacterium]